MRHRLQSESEKAQRARAHAETAAGPSRPGAMNGRRCGLSSPRRQRWATDRSKARDPTSRGQGPGRWELYSGLEPVRSERSRGRISLFAVLAAGPTEEGGPCISNPPPSPTPPHTPFFLWGPMNPARVGMLESTTWCPPSPFFCFDFSEHQRGNYALSPMLGRFPPSAWCAGRVGD